MSNMSQVTKTEVALHNIKKSLNVVEVYGVKAMVVEAFEDNYAHSNAFHINQLIYHDGAVKYFDGCEATITQPEGIYDVERYILSSDGIILAVTKYRGCPVGQLHYFEIH